MSTTSSLVSVPWECQFPHNRGTISPLTTKAFTFSFSFPFHSIFLLPCFYFFFSPFTLLSAAKRPLKLANGSVSCPTRLWGSPSWADWCVLGVMLMSVWELPGGLGGQFPSSFLQPPSLIYSFVLGVRNNPPPRLHLYILFVPSQH